MRLNLVDKNTLRTVIIYKSFSVLRTVVLLNVFVEIQSFFKLFYKDFFSGFFDEKLILDF